MAEAPSTTESISAEGEVRGRFLVGIDGRDGGRDALELARLIGSATGATISVATVIPYSPLPIPSAILDEEEAREATPLFEQAREQLGELAAEMQAFGGGSPANRTSTLR